MFSNACLGELKFEPAAAAITMGELLSTVVKDPFYCRARLGEADLGVPSSLLTAGT